VAALSIRRWLWAADVLFLVGERRLFKRCGGVKDPWMAFMLEEARKRSSRYAVGASEVMEYGNRRVKRRW
jgi:hypothetical protein